MTREDEERITRRVMSSAERMMAALSKTGQKYILSKTCIYYDGWCKTKTHATDSAYGEMGYNETGYVEIM